MVRVVGFEPTRPCGHWHLKPARLPVPTHPRIKFQIFYSAEIPEKPFRILYQNGGSVSIKINSLSWHYPKPARLPVPTHPRIKFQIFYSAEIPEKPFRILYQNGGSVSIKINSLSWHYPKLARLPIPPHLRIIKIPNYFTRTEFPRSECVPLDLANYLL